MSAEVRTFHRWDDWVPSDRLRKINDENLALAKTLRGQMDELRKTNAPKSVKKRSADSDLSSTRGSEDRQMSAATTGRGQKRGRDYEIEKVCIFIFSRSQPPVSSSRQNLRSCFATLAALALPLPDPSTPALDRGPELLIWSSTPTRRDGPSTKTYFHQLPRRLHLSPSLLDLQ